MIDLAAIIVDHSLSSLSPCSHRRAGNFFFWFGLILGVPLLATLYCREYYYALSLKDAGDQDFDFGTLS
jgi:hypothetical protein